MLINHQNFQRIHVNFPALMGMLAFVTKFKIAFKTLNVRITHVVQLYLACLMRIIKFAFLNSFAIRKDFKVKLAYLIECVYLIDVIKKVNVSKRMFLKA